MARIFGFLICRVCGNIKGHTCNCKEKTDENA